MGANSLSILKVWTGHSNNKIKFTSKNNPSPYFSFPIYPPVLQHVVHEDFWLLRSSWKLEENRKDTGTFPASQILSWKAIHSTHWQLRPNPRIPRVLKGQVTSYASICHIADSRLYWYLMLISANITNILEKWKKRQFSCCS